MTEETKNKTTTHGLGTYLWIWGLLFIISGFSYAVDYYQFQGLLMLISKHLFLGFHQIHPENPVLSLEMSQL